MKWLFHRTTWENSIRANLMLSAACVIMAVITLFAAVTSLTRHDRIVIVPAGLAGKTSVEWTSADSSYYKSFGLFVATLIGNITPHNVKFVSDALSPYMGSVIYSDIRKRMLSLAESAQFRDSATATRFVPASVLYEPDTHKVFVQGQMIITTAISSRAEEMVYEMTLVIKDGMPIVDSISSYEGTDLHTQQWLENQKAQGKETK